MQLKLDQPTASARACKKICAREFPSSLLCSISEVRLPSNTCIYYEIDADDSLVLRSIVSVSGSRGRICAIVKSDPERFYVRASAALPPRMEIGVGSDRTDWKRLISVENATRARVRMPELVAGREFHGEVSRLR